MEDSLHLNYNVASNYFYSNCYLCCAELISRVELLLSWTDHSAKRRVLAAAEGNRKHKPTAINTKPGIPASVAVIPVTRTDTALHSFTKVCGKGNWM